MILAYSSYSKLIYYVTNDHMTLRFEIFFWETTNWPQEGNRQVWSGNIQAANTNSKLFFPAG